MSEKMKRGKIDEFEWKSDEIGRIFTNEVALDPDTTIGELFEEYGLIDGFGVSGIRIHYNKWGFEIEADVNNGKLNYKANAALFRI